VNIIYFLDLIGTFTFAVSGALAASNKRFDLFGALSIAFVTAVGGGTTRDLILGLTPVFWIKDISYLIVILSAVAVTLLFGRKIASFKRSLLFFDAIGIGVFTLIGVEKSTALEIAPIFAVMMGVLTAVMGGVLRDVFVNEIPLIFQREIYATACFIGGIIYFLLSYFNLDKNIIYLTTMLVIIALRLFSIYFHWSLPKTGAEEDAK
jgi:uncharacterized membrane protein YeiH